MSLYIHQIEHPNVAVIVDRVIHRYVTVHEMYTLLQLYIECKACCGKKSSKKQNVCFPNVPCANLKGNHHLV